MPKRQQPWPNNLMEDFSLPADTTPEGAEAFIAGLPITDRNRAFLRQRYQSGKTFTEIAAEHGMTPPGVRLAVIAMQQKFATVAIPAPVKTAPPVEAPGSETAPASPGLQQEFEPIPDGEGARPLSLNLRTVRRTLGLTQEEFARPIIDGGESLIDRLEVGLSRPSQEIVRMICDAWGVCKAYLLTGQGPMFEMDLPGRDHTAMLIALLKQYLSIATFDKRGKEYWKESLTDDLCRFIDVKGLSGAQMCRVIRLLYDHLDVEQFCALLERMGR